MQRPQIFSYRSKFTKRPGGYLGIVFHQKKLQVCWNDLPLIDDKAVIGIIRAGENRGCASLAIRHGKIELSPVSVLRKDDVLEDNNYSGCCRDLYRISHLVGGVEKSPARKSSVRGVSQQASRRN